MQESIIYVYDGTFDGLLCCVFASYTNKEIPTAIYTVENMQPTLLMQRKIITDTAKAQRVLLSIPQKISQEALNFIRLAFLTCLVQKELSILLFLRLGYQYGQHICRMLTNDTVHKLTKAVRTLENESHLLKGFIRFEERSGVLASKIGPKNFVLPLLSQHFCERYPQEKFLIYDTNHQMVLVYKPYQAAIMPAAAIEMPDIQADEVKYQELWRIFHNTIAISERYNPKCQMNLVPKRYWHYMTEFMVQPKQLPKQLP